MVSVNRNPKSERNIKRIDAPAKTGHGGTHGFQVYFKRKGVEFTRQFSDKKYGGELGALKAAREFRDKAQEALPAVSNSKGAFPAANSRNKANKTGHVGLHFRSKRLANGKSTQYVVAVAAPAPLKQIKKEFRIGDRLLDEVFNEALAWRQGIIEARRSRELSDKETWDEALAGLLAKGQKNLNSARRLKVFLCHSKDDKEQVRKLYLRLLSLGCQPWLDDESLLPGQDWDSEIRKAIRSSHVFIACLSSGSVTKRGYVQKEIRFALDVASEIPEDDIFIVPIKLEPCEVPPTLSKWQWLEAYVDGYGRLITSLAQQTSKLGLEPLRSDISIS
jgi:hypothetical protein